MSYKGSKCIDCGAEITTDGAGHRPVDKGYIFPLFEGPLCPICWRRDVDRRFDLHEQGLLNQSSEFNEKGEDTT